MLEGWNSWNFTVADDAVFFLMLMSSLAIGVYSAFKTQASNSTLEYLHGGASISPLAVSFSMLGGVISAIAILGNATEMYFYGTQLSMNIVGNIFGVLVVRNIFLPVLYPLHIVSMNEYIELRFKSPQLRLLASGCQLVSSFFYMGICLYAPSMTLSSVTGLPVWASVISMGSIFTFYITIGGARAVVYTDVVQTITMFAGVLVVTAMCCSKVGGIEHVFDVARKGGRLEFFNLDTSLYTRHTFWSTNVFGVYVIVSMLGLNQSQFQRFSSLKSLEMAKTLCMLFPVGYFLFLGVFYLSGLVAYATYHACDPFTSGRITKPDEILPYLVTDKLSAFTGLAGFFVAAVYGGVLSTLSSQGNAIACVIWEDFLKRRPYFKDFTDKNATNAIKKISGITGVVAIAWGMLVGNLGTIFMVAYSIMSALKGPLSGLFLAGICTPWVNRKGAAVGFVASFLTNSWLIIGKFLRGGGNPPTMPLSVVGCPENIKLFENDTGSYPLYNITDEMWIENATQAFPLKGTFTTLYDISYCYSGVTGILLCLVISSFISFCTGPLKPKGTDPRYVNKTCAWLYLKIYEIASGQRSLREEGEGEDAKDPEETTAADGTKTPAEDSQSMELLPKDGAASDTAPDGAEDIDTPSTATPKDDVEGPLLNDPRRKSGEMTVECELTQRNIS